MASRPACHGKSIRTIILNRRAASMTSELDAIRAEMRANYLPSEEEALQRLVGQAALSADERASDLGAGRRSGARRARLVRPAADGGFPLGLRPVDQGRRGADVPGRGAAARARRRDHGRADPRQDRAARLVGAFGRLQLDLRQRLDLGADAHRPGARRRRGRHRRHAARHGAPARRAGDPHGGVGGDARDGRAVRARPHHRGSGAGAAGR